MVQLKLIPQADLAGANRRIGEKTHSASSTIAARTASVRSVASSMEAWKNASRGVGAPVAAPISRQSVSPAVDTPPATPGLKLTSGVKLLIAALVFVALLPNLILGAMFWFGAINPPSR